jgi:hypothetical protein
MNSEYNKDLSKEKAKIFLQKHNTEKEIPVIT